VQPEHCAYNAILHMACFQVQDTENSGRLKLLRGPRGCPGKTESSVGDDVRYADSVYL
jgi:hypothetical protein